MILRNATIKYAGYDPDKLSKGSGKRVCVSCDSCGRIRWLSFKDYRDLCHQCSLTTDQYKNKTRGENSSNWEGGKIKITCDECKKEIMQYKLRINTNNFCNHECHSKWLIGKKFSDETKRKMSKKQTGKNNNMYGMTGENSPAWKGGLPIREHVLNKKDCFKLNKRFNGSVFHHLSRSYGVYIPKELHEHLYHNLKTGQGMDEMSILAFQFIKGEL